MLTHFVQIGTVIAVLWVTAGVLAWWLPWLELFNDLRIVILFGTGVLFTTSLMIAAWHQAAVAASVIFATLLLSLVPFLTAAKRRKQNSPLLRLLSFNIQTTNQRFREIAAFIARTNADVVIVQEVDRAAATELLCELGEAYPHMHCGGKDREVGLALYSKHSPLESGAIDRTAFNPGVVWARYCQDAISYEVIGVYLAYPLHPRVQARHINWLIGDVRARTGPLIVAGDFNLTPFSAKLTKFAIVTGLRRHATLLATWPADKFFPAFLIDHVFATCEFFTVKVATGPFLGSDHRPIIADIGMDDPTSQR